MTPTEAAEIDALVRARRYWPGGPNIKEIAALILEVQGESAAEIARLNARVARFEQSTVEQIEGKPGTCTYCHGVGACPRCWGRAAVDALAARVEEAERERKQLIQCAKDQIAVDKRICEASESRARRFEALIRYAEGFMFIDDKGHYIGRIFRDGTGWRQPGIGGAALLGTDLDSALRALSDAGLLPDDVRSE